MNRALLALVAASSITIAAPASAFSFDATLPNLSFPPKTETDVTQGCADMTIISGETCPEASK